MTLSTCILSLSPGEALLLEAGEPGSIVVMGGNIPAGSLDEDGAPEVLPDADAEGETIALGGGGKERVEGIPVVFGPLVGLLSGLLFVIWAL